VRAIERSGNVKKHFACCVMSAWSLAGDGRHGRVFISRYLPAFAALCADDDGPLEYISE